MENSPSTFSTTCTEGLHLCQQIPCYQIHQHSPRPAFPVRLPRAIQQAQDALAQQAPESELQQKMDHADEIMTTCMLRAEKSVLPSKRALSHPWSPALVMAQKKKGLIANLLSILGARNAPSPRIVRRFHRNVHAIDPTWVVPPLSPSSI